jgi:hypothetical protein
MARAACEAVEFPDQDTVDLMVPGRRHQARHPPRALPAGLNRRPEAGSLRRTSGTSAGCFRGR